MQNPSGPDGPLLHPRVHPLPRTGRFPFSYKDASILSSERLQASREEKFLKKTTKDIRKGRVVAHVLEDTGREARLGFFTLRADRLDEWPVAVIEYLFVVEAYRKRRMESLKGLTPAHYLMATAYKTAHDISQKMALKYLALRPDNERLEKYYRDEYGFKPLQKNGNNANLWLVQPVS